MRLSTRGEYASRAMLELAVRYGQGPVPIRIISLSQAIPQQFLEQILLLLKRAGYVKSKKGPAGGYYLSRPPAEINVAEVIRVMDGPLAPINCVSVMEHEPCPLEERCGLKWLWKEVRDMVAAHLEKTSFEDVLKRQLMINQTAIKRRKR
ncbi:MAG: Rrf2 family transcriptional regulator [Candidatus Aminicenantes bacterium]|uniref:Putative transcriptional regulator of sulfate adenylyltransferase, Rrf2 family n=1 Tax=Candidatus Saccharicenans subterraneus TaxID=2508984 RepID=A0A3E2BQ86_9BACT|nr:Rrf2 family transcriptional regulator [Candidatus Aminicenantes bacterium]RFT16888.1 MAG: putative transcriptional regulator of sulfate adenylyltransferase, Rrf2 family [Candidatus Saccharicenans subterraneum]